MIAMVSLTTTSLNLWSVFVYILYMYFNAMFLNGIFPFSDALIVPVHKTGDISIPDNYSGLSLLSNRAKLFTMYFHSK